MTAAPGRPQDPRSLIHSGPGCMGLPEREKCELFKSFGLNLPSLCKYKALPAVACIPDGLGCWSLITT
ncbi:hypothetical protein Y1Q_0000505 [Alligator mississippiensis]|uniref:Uncharacterized protein n=1 Tax=Alligator mississippiensis TaxID=8496 RepID=A0A151MBG6_ALLMI|nr:hypothetical protein Y1Q_0000505 [Alligator mississippiensis]